MMKLPRYLIPFISLLPLLLLAGLSSASPSEGQYTQSIALPPLPHFEAESDPNTAPVAVAKKSPQHAHSPMTHVVEHANPVSEVEQGLDVILVMDSSGSMKKNDPNDLRKPAAKLLLSLLGKRDRASVVSFSDQGYPVAYLTQTDGDLNNDILFKAVDKVSNKGGYTNLSGAIQAATRVYEQAWDHQRKHVIVLMSDGKMDLASAELDKKATAELIMKLLPALKEKQIQVHTIAFTDNSDMRLLQSIANLTDGHFNIARTDKELHRVFASIFEQSKEPDILPMQGGRFTVDHNVREITIIANKASLETQVSLTSPSSRIFESDIVPGDIKWLVSDQFDLITIQNPEPGSWQMLPEGEANRAYIITDLKMALKVSPEHPQRGEQLDIKVWLEERGHLIDKQPVLAALRVDIVQSIPNGQSQRVALFSERAANGALTGYFNANMVLTDYGRYRIEVTASTGTFDRVKSKVIDLTPSMKPEQVLNALEDPHSTVLQPLAGAERLYMPPPPAVLHAPAVTEPPVKQPLEPVEHSVAEVEHHEEESGVMLAIIIFIAFNLIIAAALGIVWWVNRQKMVARKIEAAS